MVRKKILFNGTVVGSYEATGNVQADAAFVHEFLADKGLIKEIPRHRQIHGQANSFAEVANAIYEKGLKVSPYKGTTASPFVVNATFGIELYLKAVLDFYGVKAWGHDLANLFGKLPKDAREVFETAANDIAPLYKLSPGLTYASILKSLGKAFEQWRYIFENSGMSVEVQAIRYAMHTSHEASCRIRKEEEEK
jgi:hypothetical protein